MSQRPIFMATHPRACSTAFERVFMTRRDILNCAHEPFGDAFYYGPERLSDRFENDEDARIQSGFAKSTYKTVTDRLEHDAIEGKRVFIKDIAHYLLPPNGKPAELAPSLLSATKHTNGFVNSDTIRHRSNGNGNGHTNGHVNGDTNGHSNGTRMKGHSNGHTNGNGAHVTGTVNGPTMQEPENPTVMPTEMLRGFHFTFLIRHPRRSIPSYFRCTVPPLDDITGFHDFMPSEAGYDELRRMFDYLLAQKIIGPEKAGETDDGAVKAPGQASITVIDADDLLANPEAIIKVFCNEVGIDYTPNMLKWDDDENQNHAAKAFEKWYGFHHDAIESTCLKPRGSGHKAPTVESENADWTEKFGEKAAKMIRQTVNDNIADYEYLKSFAIKV